MDRLILNHFPYPSANFNGIENVQPYRSYESYIRIYREYRLTRISIQQKDHYSNEYIERISRKHRLLLAKLNRPTYYQQAVENHPDLQMALSKAVKKAVCVKLYEDETISPDTMEAEIVFAVLRVLAGALQVIDELIFKIKKTKLKGLSTKSRNLAERLIDSLRDDGFDNDIGAMWYYDFGLTPIGYLRHILENDPLEYFHSRLAGSARVKLGQERDIFRKLLVREITLLSRGLLIFGGKKNRFPDAAISDFLRAVEDRETDERTIRDWQSKYDDKKLEKYKSNGEDKKTRPFLSLPGERMSYSEMESLRELIQEQS